MLLAVVATTLSANTAAAAEDKSLLACVKGEVYDDSSAENNYYLGGSIAGYVQLFRPALMPYRYDQVCVFLLAGNATPDRNMNINIVFHATDGPDGAPGTLLGSVPAFIDNITTNTPGTFYTVNLGGTGPVIEEPEVYIGFTYNAQVEENFFSGIDTSPGTPLHPSYSTTDGGATWKDLREAENGGARALMLRADGDPVCGAAEDLLLAQFGSFSRRPEAVTTGETSYACGPDSPPTFTNASFRYAAMPIISDSGGVFTAHVSEEGSDLGDVILAVYCDEFNPVINPSTTADNLVAYDFNNSPLVPATITTAHNVVIPPATRYWLVVHARENLDHGNVRVCLGTGFRRDETYGTVVQGSLTPSSPRIARHLGNTAPSDSCAVVSGPILDSQVPYMAIPFHPQNGDYLDIEILNDGTTISDTSMYLYCGDFDPENPGENLAWINDDADPNTRLSAFSREVAFGRESNQVLWLVIISNNFVAPEYGDVTVQFRNDVRILTTSVTCPEASLYGQPPLAPAGLWEGATSTTWLGGGSVERFTGAAAPIAGVHWWGRGIYQLGGSVCNDLPETYELTFFLDNQGAVGNIAYQEIVTPTLRDEGPYTVLPYAAANLTRFTAPLATPLNLDTGWFMVRSVVPAQNSCNLFWVRAASGDGTSDYVDNNIPVNSPIDLEFAFCLLSTLDEGEGDPEGEPEGGEGEGGGGEGEGDGGGEGEGEGEFSGIPAFAEACIPGDGHDDGTVEFAQGVNNGTASIAFVERYTPQAYPASYQSVCVCLTRSGQDTDLPLEIVFYGDNGGEPGIFLGSVPYTARNVPDALPGAFYSVDVSNVSITLNGGSVFVGVQWAPFLHNNFQLCIDSSPETPLQDSFFSSGASIDWLDTLSGLVGIRALMIRPSTEPAQSNPAIHSADQNNDGRITLSELLRVIQFFNSTGYRCDPQGEDGFAPGLGSQACAPHSTDYNPQDWRITLSELLRLIQFYNSTGYHPCPEAVPPTEDGFCVGTPA